MKEQWIIKKKQDAKYPDIYTYEIMEKNTDAGKSGVVYSGEYLFICETDHEPSAHLIAAAPDMYEALKRLTLDMKDIIMSHPELERSNARSIHLAEQALLKAEGKSC